MFLFMLIGVGVDFFFFFLFSFFFKLGLVARGCALYMHFVSEIEMGITRTHRAEAERFGLENLRRYILFDGTK